MNNGFSLNEVICDESGQPSDFRILDVNPAFESLMGFKKEHLVGRTYRQLAGVIDPLLIERCGRVALSGEQDAFEIYSHKVERHFELKVYRPAPLQFAVIIRESREDRDSLPVKHEFPQDRGLSRLADCASVSEERGLFL